MESKLKIEEYSYTKEGLNLKVKISCPFIDDAVPRVKAVFSCMGKTRRLPLLVSFSEREGDTLNTVCEFTYRTDLIFYGFVPEEDTLLSFEVYYGNEHYYYDETLTIPVSEMKRKTKPLKKRNKPLHKLFRLIGGVYFRMLCLTHPVEKGKVSFLSGRRTNLGGNMERVYNFLKDDKRLDIRFLFFTQNSTLEAIKNTRAFLLLYATSEVVVIDDFFRLMSLVKKRDGVRVVQLWHACGAFKTFGFSRMGKEGGPQQSNLAHRMYDYALVSSEEIAVHYAEGFGISDENVLPLGVARCDAFFDEDYKQSVTEQFYEKHPKLRDKKLILFAPTFRGNGQLSAYYPTDRLDVERLYEDLDGEYAILVKLHPFCRERYNISERFRDVIIDLSDEDELNDLLFVTDLLITDYSSVIFEASLLNIPMLFYAYDLEEYVATRDFYYDYKYLVPGKIVSSQQELEQSIADGDFEHDKVEPFKERFFGDFCGGASQRAAELIKSLI